MKLDDDFFHQNGKTLILRKIEGNFYLMTPGGLACVDSGSRTRRNRKPAVTVAKDRLVIVAQEKYVYTWKKYIFIGILHPITMFRFSSYPSHSVHLLRLTFCMDPFRFVAWWTVACCCCFRAYILRDGSSPLVDPPSLLSVACSAALSYLHFLSLPTP